jgi:hypothetical protein
VASSRMICEFIVRGAQANKPLADLSIPEIYRVSAFITRLQVNVLSPGFTGGTTYCGSSLLEA